MQLNWTSKTEQKATIHQFLYNNESPTYNW